MPQNHRSDWDDDLSILSAENVNFAVETAGIGSRFAAVLIDATIQLIIILFTFFILSYFVLRNPSPDDWMKWTASIAGAMLGIFVFLVLYGYYFFFEWLMRGQTPGKYWLGLRVMQVNGVPVGMWPALVRNLLRIVDWMPVCYGAGAMVALMNPLNRRIGDLVAGTIVAREQTGKNRRFVLDISEAVDAFMADAASRTTPEALAEQRAPAYFPSLLEIANDAAPPTINVAAPLAGDTATGERAVSAHAAAMALRLDDQDVELLLEFIGRRETLLPVARQRLAASLAARLATKLGQPVPPTYGVEPFLEYIAGELQRVR